MRPQLLATARVHDSCVHLRLGDVGDLTTCSSTIHELTDRILCITDEGCGGALLGHNDTIAVIINESLEHSSPRLHTQLFVTGLCQEPRAQEST